MSDAFRLRFIATQVLPLEAEARGWLRAYARSLSAADIDDVVQEALARIWSAASESIANPRAYFYATLRNLLAEQARRARIVPLERMGEIESLRIISEEPGPEQRVGARQELAQLLSVIESLPRQCRRAFELRKFAGLSQREIAARMGVSEGTVEKHLAKALLRIRAARTAVDAAAHGRLESKHRDAQRRHD